MLLLQHRLKQLQPLVRTKFSLLVLFILPFLYSCSTLKPNPYFVPYLADSAKVSLAPLKFYEGIIHPGDFLQIRFAGKSPEVTALLNNYGVAKAEAPISTS